ncbi:Aste57867_9664 [Aphanomyces stellatus]|uniref:Aste57867_9664 protein n=1 Tax=Aphanomyces stellatus TaxID=120398 RepID=A0A485KNI4_9STRA|nr:hypothetical protein As57867_009626 [Aphanomyces stellatus]VFT86543.1 Aste57867_9664 [Aphanomyces stellatus]
MEFNATKPLVVVHVEETQVERFRTKLEGLDGLCVSMVDTPLLFIKCSGPNAMRDVGVLCTTGRIAAHRMYHITSMCNDPGWIVQSSAIPRGAVYRVVAFPNQLQPKIVELLVDSGIRVHPTHHSHELHVVLSRVSPAFYFGVVEKRGVPALTAIPDAIPCRAYFKLQEVLRDDCPLPHGCRALDIGASPGGWTNFLSSNGAATVVAVDPGELTIPVDGVSIIHLNMLLEEAHPILAEMDKFHLCVCDINVRPHLMAQLIRSVTPFLHPSARLVLTLKLGRRPTDAAVEQAVDDVRVELGDDFCNFRVTWLHANTINERTLLAERRQEYP